MNMNMLPVLTSCKLEKPFPKNIKRGGLGREYGLFPLTK